MCIKFTLSLNVGSLPHFIHEMKTPEGTAQANRPRTPHLSDISSFYASIVVSPLLDGPHASFISSFEELVFGLPSLTARTPHLSRLFIVWSRLLERRRERRRGVQVLFKCKVKRINWEFLAYSRLSICDTVCSFQDGYHPGEPSTKARQAMTTSRLHTERGNQFGPRSVD